MAGEFDDPGPGQDLTGRDSPQPDLSLVFWARNMVAIRDGGMDWPGFSYEEAEWTRMRVLASAVSDAAYGTYILVNAVLFILVAAIGIAAIFLPLATLLFPIPAETSALKFTLLLAACCFVIIGLGLPLSMRAAASWCADRAAVAALPRSDLDPALAGKVSWQIGRITLVMCGLLVPGTLLFIAWDIRGGPVLIALKWLAIALMGASMALGALRTRRAR